MHHGHGAAGGAAPGPGEKATVALGLPYPKDKAGQALMRKMAKPLSGGGWIENPASLARLYDYCRRDVEGAGALYHPLPPLIAEEQAIWEIDAVINQRGFHTDGTLLNAGHKV